MVEDNLLKRITINPKILAGKPIIRNIRISVDQILKNLAAGNSIQEILEDYPEIEEDDIKACLLYAVKLIENETIYPLIPSEIF